MPENKHKSRSELRSAIFSSTSLQPAKVLVDFFGEKVEIRQPSVDTILNFRNAAEGDRKGMLVDMLITYVYVPGTDEKLFELADRDMIMAMPWGADLSRLQKAINQLTDVNLGEVEAEGNSDGTGSSST